MEVQCSLHRRPLRTCREPGAVKNFDIQQWRNIAYSHFNFLVASKSSFSLKKKKKDPKIYVQEYNDNVNPTWHTLFLQSVNNSVNMHKRLYMLHIDLKLWLLIRYNSLGQTLCATTCTTVFYTDSLINWNWPLMQSNFKINRAANLKWRADHSREGGLQ